MVRTPINLVRGLIRLDIVKDLNLVITVCSPLKWLFEVAYMHVYA